MSALLKRLHIPFSLSTNTGRTTTYLSSLCAETSDSALLGMGGGGDGAVFTGGFFVYYIHDCFICGSSDSTLTEVAAIEPMQDCFDLAVLAKDVFKIYSSFY